MCNTYSKLLILCVDTCTERERERDLNGRQGLIIKHLHRGIRPIIDQALTNLTIDQEAPDLIPILGIINPLLQPIRVITEHEPPELQRQGRWR